MEEDGKVRLTETDKHVGKCNEYLNMHDSDMTALSATSSLNRIDPAQTDDERQVFVRNTAVLFRILRPPMECSFKTC